MIANRSAEHIAAALAVAATLVAGCGESKKPKVEDAATEQREALERAKKGPYGTQVQALEKSKAMGDDINKKAQESVDRIEKDAK